MRSYNEKFLPHSLPSSSFPQAPSLIDPKAPTSPFARPTQPLQRIEESEFEEDERLSSRTMRSPPEEDSSSPIIPLSTDRSPPTVLPWISRNPSIGMESMEEYELEDDDDEDIVGCPPPCSSSPGRSSDSFGIDLFPPREASSSPQTSDQNCDSPAAHIFRSASPPDCSEFASTEQDPGFARELYERLLVAASARQQELEIDPDIASTPADRSLSVTPVYPASPTPPHSPADLRQRVPAGKDSLGANSYSCASSLSTYGSSSATRTASFVSSSSHAGYDGDIDAPACSSRALALPDNSSSTNSSTPTNNIDSVNRLLSRLNKRTYSSLGDLAGPGNNYKRGKTDSCSSSFSSRSNIYPPRSDRTHFSRVPASLRKSLSLRSDASPLSLPPEDLVPTAPATPQKTRRDPTALEIPFGVPIIAPPPEHVARLPLSKEACSKIRIRRLLDREERLRVAEGLDEVMERESTRGDGEGEEGEGDEEARDVERSKWEVILGVGTSLRNQAVEWILEVLPKKSMYDSVSSCYSSRSSSFASSAGSVYEAERPDLLDQLLTSPETRFHAAYMFTRYFYRVIGDHEQRGVNGLQKQEGHPVDGWDLVVWDIVIACLALSVKVHRDVLEPLSPVFSWEFEGIAPHKLSYENLEAFARFTAQRDVLSAFSYCLGGTPQPILDELWIALPSLQQLLDFKGGWNHTQKEAWWRLFEVVAEPDVLGFSISLLTATALVEAVIAALVAKYEYDTSSHSQVVRRRPSGCRQVPSKSHQKFTKRAEREIEGVIQDIQALLGIPDVSSLCSLGFPKLTLFLGAIEDV
ncbi:hypothetical protein B0H10DRAFT_2207962 [Mycena sp. CBHHK59/15]|nr:hypothetical protein B0H10DRAFT_2207962 [Mycena sp. CBHHK59/15]